MVIREGYGLDLVQIQVSNDCKAGLKLVSKAAAVIINKNLL